MAETEVLEKPTQKPTQKDPKKKTPFCRISERMIGQADEVRNFWCVTPPAGTDPKSLENPASWVNLARFLKARDRIEAMPEDGAWTAEYVVLHKSPIGATVFCLNHWDLEGANVADASDFEVKWGGPAVKFRVLRVSDGEVLKSGFDDKEVAAKWMADNAR